MNRATPEILAFLRENAFGHPSVELAQIVNEKFGTSYTQKTMLFTLKNHKIRNGCRNAPLTHSDRYPRQVREYIHANYKGIGPKQMTQLLNEKFGTNYEHNQIKAYYANHKLDSGLTGGGIAVPPLKGKKGCYYPGCEKAWFKKGSLPHNKVPVGTVTKTQDGYLWKKVSDEPCKKRYENWRMLHILVWEEANGPVPEGMRVIFKDGNPDNVSLENLILATFAEVAVTNAMHLRSSDPELTETGLMIAKLHLAARERSK